MIKLGSTVPFPRAFPRWLGHLFRVSRALQWVCSCLTCCAALTLNRQRSAGPYCQPPCPSDCVCEQPWGMERLDCSLAHVSRFVTVLPIVCILYWFGTDWSTREGRHDSKTPSFHAPEKFKQEKGRFVYETICFLLRQLSRTSDSESSQKDSDFGSVSQLTSLSCGLLLPRRVCLRPSNPGHKISVGLPGKSEP